MASNLSSANAIVFIGGGFAGLTAALTLSRLQPKFSIFLIEPRSEFVFLPLLYELLSEEINTWEVAPSYNSLLNKTGIIHLQDKVLKINTKENKIHLASGKNLFYNKLVVSTGSEIDDFGIPGIRENALKFEGINDVNILRKKIRDINIKSNVQKNLIIIGAGPSGVELACKVSDIMTREATIHLIEMGEIILPKSKSFNQEQARIALLNRGIKIHLATKVLQASATDVELEMLNQQEGSKFSLVHHGLIWTGGRKAVIPKIEPPIHLIDKLLPINKSLQVEGLKNVLALGDITLNQKHKFPATAQVAIQQGQTAAKILIALDGGEDPPSFDFNDLGEMLSLGIKEASITGMGFTLSGPLAFQIRRIAYISKFPRFSLGFRSAGAWLLEH